LATSYSHISITGHQYIEVAQETDMVASNWTATSMPDCKGKVVLVTGGNTGIGKITCLRLAQHHAKVYLGARTESRASDAIKEIKAQFPDAEIVWLPLDLMDFSSVRAAASTVLAKESRLDLLICSAGIMAVPYEETKDGNESQFQTNYLSHYLLTTLLIPLLTKTAETAPKGTVRIINVSSNGHYLLGPKGGIDFENINLKESSPWTRYGQSKLANVLHAKALTKHYPSILSIAVHPGAVNTELLRGPSETYGWLWTVFKPLTGLLGYVAFLTPEQGAVTSLWAATSPDLTLFDSGNYYEPYGKQHPGNKVITNELVDRLWTWTQQRIGG
jgi:NAD(P)-dependent dehydrogenase (short-subunit alcohol dehydrogenase family)